MKPLILGIDLGFNSFGVCSFDGESVESFVLFPEKNAKKSQTLVFIKEIFFTDIAKRDKLLNYILTSDLVLIEKPFNVKGFGIQLNELLGIVKYLCVHYQKPFVEVPQMTLKKFATTHGNAKKSEVVKQALKEFGFDASTEDETDAFMLSLIGDVMLQGKKSIAYTKARAESIVKLEIQNKC